MDNNDIELIAKSLGLKPFRDYKGAVLLDNAVRFDPENDWRDTGLVFEALIEKTSEALIFRKYISRLEDPKEGFMIDIGGPENYKRDPSLQAAICKAYLSLIKDGE